MPSSSGRVMSCSRLSPQNGRCAFWRELASRPLRARTTIIVGRGWPLGDLARADALCGCTT